MARLVFAGAPGTGEFAIFVAALERRCGTCHKISPALLQEEQQHQDRPIAG